ncbi:hypothetical protein GYA19_00400 [Candidatus Beckwithbacteria bacterium]|nr:hypothetical protein [Candidatus Beckwithbacteria bacterium]
MTQSPEGETLTRRELLSNGGKLGLGFLAAGVLGKIFGLLPQTAEVSSSLQITEADMEIQNERLNQTRLLKKLFKGELKINEIPEELEGFFAKQKELQKYLKEHGFDRNVVLVPTEAINSQYKFRMKPGTDPTIFTDKKNYLRSAALNLVRNKNGINNFFDSEQSEGAPTFAQENGLIFATTNEKREIEYYAILTKKVFETHSDLFDGRNGEEPANFDLKKTTDELGGKEFFFVRLNPESLKIPSKNLDDGSPRPTNLWDNDVIEQAVRETLLGI